MNANRIRIDHAILLLQAAGKWDDDRKLEESVKDYLHPLQNSTKAGE